MPRSHHFSAVAFEQNLSLKETFPKYRGARLSAHHLEVPLGTSGDMFLFPFGAIVFQNVPPERREAELAKLRQLRSGLTAIVEREEFNVIEEQASSIQVRDGALVVDRLTSPRAVTVALIVAQSAAMEYYERIVDRLFGRTDELVEHLERTGTISTGTRRLHRFIAEAIGTRNETITVLHLLDKPDANWDDPAMDRIYSDLRAEFDLMDRFAALEAKLRGVQESLELITDVARDKRLFFLEATVVLLIVIEIALSLLRAH